MKHRISYCPRGRKYRGERVRRRKWPWLLAGLAVVLLSPIFLWENELSPVAADLAANEAKRAAAQAVSETVEEVLHNSGIDGDSFVSIERSSEGEVQTVSANIAEMNLLRAEIASAVEEKIEGGHVQIGVPIGTLTGNSFLHGKGPEIPVTVTLAGNAEVDFESGFESAGINQTVHRVILKVHTGVYTFLEKERAQEIELSIPVAETVIVGDVPQTALFSMDPTT